MDYKGCIVVQGETNLEALPKIRKCFEGYQIIYSCWVDDDVSEYLPTDIVILNEKPEDFGPGNFYLQRESTLAGMRHACELDWKRALKWRSDMWCTDVDELMRIFDKDSLNLYFWIKELSGYITDFFMEGEIDDIVTLYSTDIPQHKYNYPEFGITLQLVKNGLDKKTKFMGNRLDTKCDIFWEKYNCWMSQNQKDAWYLDKFPDNLKDWIPTTRRGIPINLFP